VVLGTLSDGRKVVLAVTPGYRESTENWGAVLRDLRERGLRLPQLVVSDGYLGIWKALHQLYLEAEEQRCWNHKIINVFDKLPTRQQSAGTALLRQIPAAPTRREGKRRREQFVAWCGQYGYADAAKCLEMDWEPASHVLPLPATPLATSANVESRRVTIRGGAPADGCGQVLQTREERYGCHLERCCWWRSKPSVV